MGRKSQLLPRYKPSLRKRETILPPVPGCIDLLIRVCERCVCASLSPHICIAFFSLFAEHNPRTVCRGIQSEQLMLFWCVSRSCFSSIISLFLFFSPFSSFLSQTRTNTVRLAENWQASAIQRQ